MEVDPQQRTTFFQQVMNETQAGIWTLCLRMLGNRVLAEDAFQECYLSAWRSFDSFRGEARPGTWLWRIAVRSCLEIRRRETRQGHVDMEQTDGNLLRDPGDDPGGTAERRDTEAYLLAALTPGQRAIVHLRYTEDLPLARIAEVLGMSLSAVKVSLHRARNAMRLRWERGHEMPVLSHEEGVSHESA